MNARTVIGFVLIGVVIFIFWDYLPRQRALKRSFEERERSSERPAEVTRSGSRGQRAADSLTLDAEARGTTAAPSTAIPEAASFEEQWVSIQTPQAVGSVSTRGGVLTSWKLLNFQGPGDDLVELIPPGVGALAIAVANGSRLDLRDVEFVPNRRSIRPEEGEAATLVLRAHLSEDRAVERLYRTRPDGYALDVEVRLIGFDRDARVEFSWTNGIAQTEAVLEESFRKAYTYMGGEIESFDADEDDEVKTKTLSGGLAWIGLSNKYFLAALLPEPPDRGREWEADPGGDWEVALRGEQGSEGRKTYDWGITSSRHFGEPVRAVVYLGPQELDRLAAYGQRNLVGVMDLGWWFVRPISEVVVWFFGLVVRGIPESLAAVRNGLALIFFGVIIKIIVYPLTHKSYQSMAKMQQIQPKMKALQERFKDDKMRLNQAMMKLYKAEGVNPLGGCLPMVLQMPIFIALWSVFRTSIELRQSSFLWLSDLSLPDSTLILPILMGLSVFVQQKLSVRDPKQQFMVYIMPVILVIFFRDLPSGLVLYYTVFNVLSIGQQMLINRRQMPFGVPASTG